MGGFGSGRGERFSVSRRPTLAGLGRLDIRALHRQGALNGEEHWRLLRYERGWLLLVMTYQEGALAVELSGRDRQVIPIGWTPCHYGGRRPWFHCPWCERRVAVLYGGLFTLRCHRCSHRLYASQCITAEDRHYQRVRQIRARLGASPDLSEPIDPATKPQGMHWRTWRRLCAQEAVVHRRILQRHHHWFARLLVQQGLA